MARFGTEHLAAVLAAQGRRIVVVDEGETDDDLVCGMIEVLTSMCARLGSTDVVVGHFRFGSAGQRPPRVSMAMPIRASGLW